MIYICLFNQLLIFIYININIQINININSTLGRYCILGCCFPTGALAGKSFVGLTGKGFLSYTDFLDYLGYKYFLED